MAKGLPLNRREFLGVTVVGGGAALAASLVGCGESSEHVPVIVIGSGFGGAIAALRLTLAGVPVTLLERGRRWPISADGTTFSRQFPPDQRSTWLSRSTNLPVGIDIPIEPYIGVLERVDAEGIQVYAGAGYGGGSLVYGSMSVTPPRSVFEQVFPSILSYDELDAVYYPRVRQMLQLAQVPADLMASAPFQAARVFQAQAAAANLPTFIVDSATDWDVIRREVAGELPPSALDGELIYGANSGYKTSLDKNYLAMAEATGLLSVRTQHLVTEIEEDGGRYVVHAHRIDEAGGVVATQRLTCDHLFLAAGSMGTTSLLVRARAEGALGNLDETVGTGWGTNGNAMFLRQNVGADTGEIQALPPVTGINWPTSPLGPVLVEHAPYPTGFPCGCLLSLACTLTSGRGTFRYDAAAKRAILTYPPNGNDEAVAVARQVADALTAANGGTLGRPFHDGSDVTRGFTYHPLGGAVIGQACDQAGRVNGHPGLYVVDGSLLPGTSACANPSLTIAAIAERCLDSIVAEDF